jgi:hypothetical protein
MTTKKQYDILANRVAITLTLIFLIIVFLLFANKLKAQTTGYYVVVTINKKSETVKTADKQIVLNLIEAQFPGLKINLDEAVNRTKQPTFEVYAGNEGIYVEKKRLVKVRKNGKLKLRRCK